MSGSSFHLNILIKQYFFRALFSISLFYSSCGQDPKTLNKSLDFVTLYPPIAWLVSQIVGDSVSVHSLIPPGADPHVHELRPADLRAIKSTSVLFGFGEAWRENEQLLKNQFPENAKWVDISLGIEPLFKGGAAADPHLWYSLRFMSSAARIVTETLVKLSPEFAERFQKNGFEIQKKLSELEARYRLGLNACKSDTIWLSHSSLAYMARDFGLIEISISGPDDENTPSPQEMEKLLRMARDSRLSVLLEPAEAHSRLGPIFAKEAGATLLELEPLLNGEDYLSAMSKNLPSLIRACVAN